MTTHIATPAEIGGSADNTEIPVLHVSGPFVGMLLLNKKADATLAPGISNSEIIPGTGFLPTPTGPTILDVLPNTGPVGISTPVVLKGSNMLAAAPYVIEYGTPKKTSPATVISDTEMHVSITPDNTFSTITWQATKWPTLNGMIGWTAKVATT